MQAPVLIPEWTSIDAVILAWPHENTDWQPWLASVRDTYLSLIEAINHAGSGVILLARPQDIDEVKAQLPASAKVFITPADYNDTWVRDYAFLTCHSAELGNIPVEFTFNGWGNKFDARKDNLVNQKVLAALCQQPMRSSSWVAEGGALEIDDEGTLLSTSLCLLNPERNGDATLEQYKQEFARHLGCNKTIILEQGHLEGDDTDGHIDTLVRFTPAKGLVIQAAENRPDDSHYAGLHALVEECQQALPQHEQFLLPLPAMFNEDNERLPASYANFLICNDHILAPIYQQTEDAEALETLQKAYPKHQVVGINCAPLVQQFGSLHCISMQVPQHTLKSDVIELMKSGVHVYAAN